MTTRSMADLKILNRSSAGLDGRYYRTPSLISARRASSSNIGYGSRPSSQSGAMQQRQSFSSSTSHQPTRTLFIDTPKDPGTSFVFLHRDSDEAAATSLGHSRPVSHSGSSFSMQTLHEVPGGESSLRVEFGKAVPAGCIKVPTHTIRRIDDIGADSHNKDDLPALPDSPIAFEEQDSSGRHKAKVTEQESVSRASKWSTKPQTSPQEMDDQEQLMEQPKDEDVKSLAPRCELISRVMDKYIPRLKSGKRRNAAVCQNAGS